MTLRPTTFGPGRAGVSSGLVAALAFTSQCVHASAQAMPDSKPLDHIFGGNAGESMIHPSVLAAMLIAMLLILVLPRRYVLIPVLCTIFLVPSGQAVEAVGAHWFVSRLIVLAGLMRAIAFKVRSREPLFTDWPNTIDRAFIGCVLFETVA